MNSISLVSVYNKPYVGFTGNQERLIKKSLLSEELKTAINTRQIRWSEVKTPFDTVAVIAERKKPIPQGEQTMRIARNQLREEIADKLYGTGAKIKNKEAFLIIGPTAAGKSTYSQKIIKEKGAYFCDRDAAKRELPEYVGQNEPRFADESRYISGLVLERAVKNSDNIVLETSGQDKEPFDKIMQRLIKDNYKINLTLMYVNPKDSAKRAVKRWENGDMFTDPSDILFKYSTKAAENYPDYLAKYRNNLASSQILDNSDFKNGPRAMNIAEMQNDIREYKKWQDSIVVRVSPNRGND